MWCQANKAVTGNQETFWTNMDRASIRGLMQNSVTLWRHWHYDVTSWHAQTVRQNATVGAATPPAPETIQMISRKLLQSLHTEETLKYPPRLGPWCWGCEGAPLTRGAGDKLWHPDNIGTWSLTLADTSPRTHRRGLVISIHADCRLPLSETFSCYETITMPGVWNMLHKTFICLSF